jgi:hypothetical protein
MLATDRTIFDEPLHEKLKKSPGSLELWFQRTRPIVALSKKEATKASIARTHKHITPAFFSQK